MPLLEFIKAKNSISKLTLAFERSSSFIEQKNLWICGLFSLFLTLKFYPGLFYYDVIWQINWVEYICKAIKAHTLAFPPDFFNQWPIWNVFIRIPLFLITKDFGIFILLSAFFFLYSVLELHRKLGYPKTFIITASIFVFSPFAGWMILHGPHLFVTACVFCFVSCQISGAFRRALIFVGAAILLRPEMALIFFLCALLLILSRRLPPKAGMATLAACVIAVAASQIKVGHGGHIRTMNLGPSLVGLYLLSQIPGTSAPVGDFAPDKPVIDATCSLNMWCQDLQKSVNWDKLYASRLSGILPGVGRIIAENPREAAALMAERTKIFLFRRLSLAELGRPDMLKFANSKVIQNSLTDNVVSLVSRHQSFYNSALGAIYIPIVFMLLPFVFAIPLRSGRIFVTSLALAISTLCFTLVYPTDEIRYYFPEIAWMIVLAPASMASLALMVARRLSSPRPRQPAQDRDLVPGPTS
ncbi:hypothetical protein CCR94_22790 [Rhodoblastus sphagnicola]|uniref:Uncharacterized protein n=1 Tax=Rhodoblastus sphagnicola TaxID=333368 RepID=A0A2S6MVR4_9HYPH|nr:hypothetical protein [Rhodoblastus sphagnicola]MBB4198322.1 hypothetical protein [Rhodoblastus sphagnicola]PPQ26454.1 hypothetical protein CCR94_22790 [Rhodoblastus sphagnicola]